MAKIIFVLITQLRNSTNRRVGFRVDGYCPPLRTWRPAKRGTSTPPGSSGAAGTAALPTGKSGF
ncbi:UNVERIFIED_CONTAM: hypothetical protein Sangu_1836500 [Sesamum angustifolium]|uniref:Uncharacterized protein n=1 Tax=Sesamum angustifolium TaxID=2727405 RepID=A0AAW2M866_9LAMI